MSDVTQAPQAPTVPVDSVARAAELERTGNLAEAQACIDRVLAQEPDNAEAVHLSGVLAFRDGRVADAAALMERSLTLGTPKPYFLRNLCEAYRYLGRYDEGVKVGEAAVKADPRDPIALINLAVLHYARRDPEASIEAARKALALDDSLPGAHFALAEAFLLQGKFEQGWEEYEWRFRLPGVPKVMPLEEPPQWKGDSLPEGRLILIADQGFGDCIQFCRYIPWAAEQCADIVIACSRELQPIMRQLAPGAKLFDQWKDCPPSQAFIPLSGLPRLHKGGVASIPLAVPYLHAPADKIAIWKPRVAALTSPHHRRVGLVWAGRPTHKNDRNRSVSLAAFAPLGRVPGLSFISLQQDDPRRQISAWFEPAPLVNLGADVGDFADTMAVIDSLDLVVTVDTAVGHLTAALGKPVWILTPFAPDWRWLMERTDSPWYPSVRLFRQKKPGEWAPVVEEVAAALTERFSQTD